MINFQHSTKRHERAARWCLLTFPMFFLTAACLSVPTAVAADVPKIPKSGAAEYVTIYTGTVHQSIELQNGKRAEIRELIGLTRDLSASSQYGGLSVRCLVYFEATNSRPHISGNCTHLDSDGDKMFQRFAAGKIDLLGGTGKYEGITGTGSITDVQNFRSQVDPIRLFEVHQEISWEFN